MQGNTTRSMAIGSVCLCVYVYTLSGNMGFPGGLDSKESVCNAGELDSVPVSGRFPWKREWLPTPVFLPGESHKQRSLGRRQSMGLQSRR